MWALVYGLSHSGSESITNAYTEKIEEGDHCSAVSVAESIALKDFYFLNPDINEQCNNLYLGLAYCVEPVGDIETYSAYPQTTNFISLPSPTYSTFTQDDTQPFLLPVPTFPADSPLASGSLHECYAYRNHRTSKELMLNTNLDDLLNSCSYVASVFHVSVARLLEWNPSLDAHHCALQPGYRYCAVRNEDDMDTGC